MSAHMAVIEAIMLLYAKEVVSPDRVLAAVQRFNQRKTSSPENYEQGLLLWITHGCEALKKRIEQETESNMPNGGGEGDRLHSPEFPKVQDFKDLCDGVALAALISFYCPDELPWSKIRVSYLPTVSESLHNIGLVQSFCQRCLPASIFHMVPEDVTYMRGSMKQNLVVFLADLFNLLEINPAKCVRYPEMDKTSSNEGFPARNAHGVVHKRNLLHSVMSPIPDLRSGLDDSSASSAFQVMKTTPTHMPLRKTNSFQQSMSEMSEDSLRRGSEDSFVVHRSKNIPTLSSVINDEPLVPARLKSSKEKQNHDSKAEERGETVAAGRPSNWEDSRKISYGGRRSRRSSVSEESQLTIENFGGSQDNINFIGKNPDKEVAVHVGRKISAPAFIENPAVRSSVKDNRSSIQFGYDNGCEKSDEDHEKPQLRRQYSAGAIPSSFGKLNNNSGSKESIKDGFTNDIVDGEIKNRLSFADLKKDLITGGGESRAIQLVYMQQQQEKEATTNGAPSEKKTTTFATLPNTTTWQQQSSINPQNSGENNGTNENGSGSNVMSSQLNDIKMKLEEKRRHIESEKRRMEVIMNKQRQKVGKAAFLQAVTKGKGNILKSSNDTTEPNSPGGSEPRSPSTDTVSKPQRPLTLQEINDDVVNVEKKWLNQDQPFVETRRTPDIENMDLEQYQQSIAQMNSSLQNIQVDIQRLSSQQNQIQAAQQQVYSQQMQNYPPVSNYQQPPVSQYVPTYTTQQFTPQGAIYNHPLQSYSSAPHIPQAIYAQKSAPSPNIQQQEPHFYLHDQPMMTTPTPQPTPQRRTWATPPPSAEHVPFLPEQPEMRTWNKPQNPNSFVLHDVPPNDSSRFVDNSRFQNVVSSPKYHQRDQAPKYQQNGEEYPLNRSNSHPGFTLSQQHMAQQHLIRGSPSASPQHRNIHKQISQLMDEGKRSVLSATSTPVSLHQMDNRELRKSSITHAPIPAPPADDMEPQNISFIGSGGDPISEGISKLNITSGTRTYRIPSPTRPLVTRAFQTGQSVDRSSVEKESPPLAAEITSLDKDPTNEKGFYISFDNEQPKRPKPPLRGRKGSPKKSFNENPDDVVSFTRQNVEHHHEETRQERQKSLERELALERMKRDDREYERQKQEQMEKERQRERRETSQEKQKVTAASAIIIGNELSNPDPDVMDEKEKKKERIMLMSLQRRQQQEEAKARKEAEAEARREREKAKEEERQRKKEEQAARRAAILEQYKLKKAIEEAEREGKVLDRSELSSLKPTPKMRPKGSVTRPRPKTIHIDSGSVEMAEGMLQPSRGKKGSSSNLTANHYSSTTPIKRDYYRGSQDSLADAGRVGNSLLYRDSPDDSRGVSPCNSANQTLGRRGSYKTTSRGLYPGAASPLRGCPLISYCFYFIFFCLILYPVCKAASGLCCLLFFFVKVDIPLYVCFYFFLYCFFVISLYILEHW
ncbi:patronin isoform X4 [Agrilus planipennis]|uniref:Patronin isoform X4 n=1 Tax=Agrilus planipennis TaxID=224129 RepID=A0A7F5R4U6_AGRPL|nr:patronin isoform X4 [Agrilus planipennis]